MVTEKPKDRDFKAERGNYEAAVLSHPLFSLLVQAKTDLEVARLRYHILLRGLPDRGSCQTCDRRGSKEVTGPSEEPGREGSTHGYSVVCPVCLGGDLAYFLRSRGLDEPVVG